MSPPAPPTARVSSSGDLSGIVVSVDGSLDATAGTALIAAVSDAVAAGTARLEIDLCAVAAFDDQGAAALLTCRTLTTELAGGLHYRTQGGGAGQLALLQAYADPHSSDGSAASSGAWEPAS